MRRVSYFVAIGLIVLWTGYCLLDLVYVALNYWSLVPGLGLLPFFTDPVVEPGFWADYLKRLTTAWGSIVTGAGVVALLVRPPASAVKAAPEPAIRTYPVIPEAERTEPGLLFIEEPRPPRYTASERERTPPRREADQRRQAEAPEAEPFAARRPVLRQPALRDEPRLEERKGEPEPRPHPMRTAPIFRAIRGRSPASPQPRRAESDEEAE